MSNFTTHLLAGLGIAVMVLVSGCLEGEKQHQDQEEEQEIKQVHLTPITSDRGGETYILTFECVYKEINGSWFENHTCSGVEGNTGLYDGRGILTWYNLTGQDIIFDGSPVESYLNPPLFELCPSTIEEEGLIESGRYVNKYCLLRNYTLINETT